jgi:hypothetical protein
MGIRGRAGASVLRPCRLTAWAGQAPEIVFDGRRVTHIGDRRRHRRVPDDESPHRTGWSRAGGHEEDHDRDAQQDDREEGVGIEVVAGEVDRGTGEAEGELVALSAFLGRISSRYQSS